jgi:glucose/arabinose dehydrogenase
VPTTIVLDGWRQDAPGRVYTFSAANLPAPSPESSASNAAQIVARPEGAWPKVPPGFTVSLFAEGLQAPRVLRTAPNGDVFVAETIAGLVRVLRPGYGDAHSTESFVFASGLAQPFGLAFYPAGEHPRWLYVAETNRVIRYAYRPGATAAVGQPQVIIKRISATSAGHSNRDLAVSPDGHWMFIGVGSSSNVADGMSKKSLGEAQSFDRRHGLGAAWDGETDRAEVRSFTPEGRKVHALATGLRNCSGITVQRTSRAVWCSTNERDRLGDDLVPDYVTRVKPGAFYGWPWWYIGDHEDPRLAGERPDLRGRVTVPDVLLQSHSAPLGLSFADGAKLPDAWRGSAFVAAHGSWNRAERTGPKLIRILVDSTGAPTGAYEDVMTGFVLDNQHVWGRPVGITVAKDGSLLISDDAGGVIWQLTYQ